MGGRAREDDFDALFRAYCRLIPTTAERRVGDLATAEEVTSDVFRAASAAALFAEDDDIDDVNDVSRAMARRPATAGAEVGW